MKLEFFECPNGPMIDDGVIVSHIDPDSGVDYDRRSTGSGYATPLGFWELPEGASIGETAAGEPGIFLGNMLYIPTFRGGKTVVLMAAADTFRKDEWVFLARVK